MELPQAPQPTDGTVTHDKVIPVQAYGSSLFQYLHVYLNGTLASQYENYAYRSYLDIILNANHTSRDHSLSAMLYEKDPVNTSEKLDNPPDAKGHASRFKRTEGSTLCDLSCPIFSDICHQNKLPLNGVDIRPCATAHKFHIKTAFRMSRMFSQ